MTGIILTPQLVDLVEIFGTDGEICLIAKVALRVQKIKDVVAVPFDGLQIGGSFGTDRELVAVPQQSLQAIQTPQQDAFQFCGQGFYKERVIFPVCWAVFGSQDELPPPETVRVVVQSGQRTIAKAEKPGVDVALVTLDALALNVHPSTHFEHL